jgi:NAD(P)-dependent dehydrogenase (short-subunit alcohol dehydrogenase family)
MTEQGIAQYREAAAKTAEEQRRIQEAIDRRHREQSSEGKDGADGEAVQTAVRTEPEPPLPARHLSKPGTESELEPRPHYDAPGYKGSEKLEGMVALITGGDSGIGRAVAVLFAREGADVAILHLDEDEDADETREAVEAEGRRCLVVSGDIRDPRFCEEAVDHVVRELGKLDILVNNAAFQEHVHHLEDLDDAHLDMTMRTNVYGCIHMSRAALPHLKAGSAIINTGSETGLFGQPVLLDYSATKGAIHAFTRALASSVVGRGIRVNAVAPGPVWTPLNPADQPADRIRQFGSSTPMKRPAQPEEIAPAFVFLASRACSSYVTGAVIPVTGGVTGGA